MVDEELGRDLLSFGKKVLVLAIPPNCPGQGRRVFTEAEPDVMLTDVHRRAADDPIIRLSMDVREGVAACAWRNYGRSKGDRSGRSRHRGSEDSRSGLSAQPHPPRL